MSDCTACDKDYHKTKQEQELISFSHVYNISPMGYSFGSKWPASNWKPCCNTCVENAKKYVFDESIIPFDNAPHDIMCKECFMNKPKRLFPKSMFEGELLAMCIACYVSKIKRNGNYFNCRVCNVLRNVKYFTYDSGSVTRTCQDCYNKIPYDELRSVINTDTIPLLYITKNPTNYELRNVILYLADQIGRVNFEKKTGCSLPETKKTDIGPIKVTGSDECKIPILTNPSTILKSSTTPSTVVSDINQIGVSQFVQPCKKCPEPYHMPYTYKREFINLDDLQADELKLPEPQKFLTTDNYESKNNDNKVNDASEDPDPEFDELIKDHVDHVLNSDVVDVYNDCNTDQI